MNKLFKTLVIAISLFMSVNAFALFDNIGNLAWRANHGDFKISYAQLSGQVLYARGRHALGVSSSMIDGLCGDPKAHSQGIRLFDVIQGATYEECEKFLSDKDIVNISPIGSLVRTNYYWIIAPKGAIKQDAIFKMQMGNVDTRESPKFLGVIKASKKEWDLSCNADGEYNGVTCEGWSYQSIMPLWDTAYPDDHTSF